MDENGNLLKLEKAKQKYDLNMFSHLSSLGLIKLIPTAWKSSLRDSFSGKISIHKSMKCSSSKMA